MTRRKKKPLRTLTKEERYWLERICRSRSEPAGHVARAKEILAVSDGRSYKQAAQIAGRKSGDAVSQLVERFNQEGQKPEDFSGAHRKRNPINGHKLAESFFQVDNIYCFRIQNYPQPW